MRVSEYAYIRDEGRREAESRLYLEINRLKRKVESLELQLEERTNQLKQAVKELNER